MEEDLKGLVNDRIWTKKWVEFPVRLWFLTWEILSMQIHMQMGEPEGGSVYGVTGKRTLSPLSSPTCLLRCRSQDSVSPALYYIYLYISVTTDHISRLFLSYSHIPNTWYVKCLVSVLRRRDKEERERVG